MGAPTEGYLGGCHLSFASSGGGILRGSLSSEMIAGLLGFEYELRTVWWVREAARAAERGILDASIRVDSFAPPQGM